MKTLTLTQPWATLVAIGAKRIETRSWYTAYRGPLAIHAAKGWSKDDERLCLQPYFLQALLAAGINSVTDVPLGVVLATAHLYKVVLTENATLREATEQERAFGDFSFGRYAWFFRDVVALPTPIPARGSLGVWEWDETMLEGTP